MSLIADITASPFVTVPLEGAGHSSPNTNTSDGSTTQEPEVVSATATNQSNEPEMSDTTNISLEQVVVKQEVEASEAESEIAFDISQSRSSELMHGDCQTFREESVAPSAEPLQSGVSDPVDALRQAVLKEESIEPRDEDPETLFKLSHTSQLSQPRHSCKYCGQKLKTELSLQKHEEGHRNGTIYKCRFCNYHSLSRDFMEGHETKHTGEKPFKCDYCDHRTRYRVDLIKHQVVHFNVRKFKCHLCPYRSKWKGGIDKHLQSHSSIRNFSCPLCNARFKRKSGLKTHMTRHSSYKPFKCDECNYSCRIRSMLLMHLRTHSDVRNFVCTYPGCSQRCKTKSDLKKHASTHSETNDFHCKICGKTFKTRHSLACHVKRHNEKTMDFTCTVCEKKLSTRFGLRKHLSQHFTEKRHSCPVCDHKFHSLSNMRKHMLVHGYGSDRSFGCPVCKFYGKDLSALLAHIGQLHGQEFTYFCEECRKPFSTIQRMKQHVLRCHTSGKPKEQCEFIYNPDCCEAPTTFSQLSQLANSDSSTDFAQMHSLNLPDINTSHDQLNTDRRFEINSTVGFVSNDETAASAISDSGVNGDTISSDRDSKVSPNNDVFEGASSLENFAPGVSSDGPQDNGCSGAICKPAEPCFDSKDRNSSTACMKSLTVKLERLPDLEEDIKDLVSFEMSKAHPVRSQDLDRNVLSSIFKIGSLGSVGVCLAGKFSGISLNLEKRGKKTKKWYMSSEYLSSQAVGHGKSRSSKKPAPDTVRRKRKSQPALAHDTGMSNKRRKAATVSKPKKNCFSGRRKSVQHSSNAKSCDSMQKSESDPTLVNFDVQVKCERLDLEEALSNPTGVCNKDYEVSPKQLEYTDARSGKCRKVSFPEVNRDAQVLCKRHGSNKTKGSTNTSSKATKISNGMQLGQDDVRVMIERIESTSCIEKSTSYPYLHQIPPKSGKTLTSKSAGTEPKRVRPKENKGPKNQKKASRKDEKDPAFVEESCFVEDIMDSPFQITWKTMCNVDPSRKRATRSRPLAGTLNGDNDISGMSNLTIDQKPISSSSQPTSQDLLTVSPPKSENNSCCVQIEDIAQMYSGLSVNLKDIVCVKNVEGSSHSFSKPANGHFPPPVQTISLDEFESEYRKKKKIVAKVDIVPETQEYSHNCQAVSGRHDEMTWGASKKKAHDSPKIKRPHSPKSNKPSPNKGSSRRGSDITLSPKKTIRNNQSTSSITPSGPKRSTSTLKNRSSINRKESKPESQGKNKGGKVTKRGKLNISLFKNKQKEQSAIGVKSSRDKNKNSPGKSFAKGDLKNKNVSLSAKGEMVKRWRMALECLTERVTVDLFDYKKGKLLCLENAPANADSFLVNITEMKQSPVDSFTIINEWSEAPKAEGVENMPTLSTVNEENPEKPCDEEKISAITFETADDHENSIENSQLSHTLHSYPTLDQQASSEVQEVKEEELSFDPSSAAETEIMEDETNNCSNGVRGEKLTAFCQRNEKAYRNLSSASKGVSNQTKSCSEEFGSKANLPIINASARLFENNTSTIGETNPVVVRDRKSRNSLSEFLHHHDKLIHNLFPSCRTSVSPRILRRHLNKWNGLPLPKGFFLDNNGSVQVAGFKDENRRGSIGKRGGFSNMKDFNLSMPSIEPKMSSRPDEHIKPKVKRTRKCLEKVGGKIEDMIALTSDQNVAHENENETYIKPLTVVAEVYKPFGDASETIDAKSEGVNEASSCLVTKAGDNETFTLLTSAVSSEEQQQKDTMLTKTSNPFLCLSDDNVEVIESHGLSASSSPPLSISNHTPGQSTNSPSLELKEAETGDQMTPVAQEIYLDDNPPSCDFVESPMENRGVALLESGVLPPSDDICPLPDDFFSDLMPQANLS